MAYKYRPNKSGKKISHFVNEGSDKFKASRLWKILTSEVLKFSLILILVVTTGFFFIRFLRVQQSELEQINFSSLYQEGLGEKDRDPEYDPEEIFTILVVDQGEHGGKAILDGFIVILLDTVSHRAEVFSIHPDIYIPLQSLYGRNITPLDLNLARIRDLMVVGDLQNPPVSLAYTLYQLEEFLAMPIDGYILLPSSLHDQVGEFSLGYEPWEELEGVQGYEEWTERWVDYWTDYFKSISILRVWVNRDDLSSIVSNMSPIDVYTFAQGLSELSDEEINRLVPGDGLLVDDVDERGKVVKSITVQGIEEMLSELGRDERMDREQARIEIFNGTNIDGLGSRYERWITHIGGEVIRVKNAPGEQQKTVVYVTDPEKYEYTMGRILSLWNTVEVVEGRPDFITTGDVIIVLGMDF